MESCLSSRVLFIFIVSSVLQIALSDDRSDVCGYFSGSIVDPSQIAIPENFKVNVETVAENNQNTGQDGFIKNTVIHYSGNYEFLKYATNSSTKKEIYVYDYMYGQKLYYDLSSKTSRGTCKRDQILDAIPGFWLVPSAPDYTSFSMPTSREVLRLEGNDGFGGSIQLYYQGQAQIRGLQTNKYYSCQKFKDISGIYYTAKVTHYIQTDTGSQFTELYTGPLPVMIVFDARNTYGQQYTYTYNMFYYQTDYDLTSFLWTPDGVVCEGRAGPDTFPATPNYISYVMEVHNQNTYQTLKMVYNYEGKYVYSEIFNPQKNGNNPYLYNDYESGWSYDVDPDTGVCKMISILDQKTFSFGKSTKTGVRIDSPSEFFLNSQYEWHYNGQAIFRGVSTDSWIAQDPSDPNRVLQTYFLDVYTDATVNDFAIYENGVVERVPYMTKEWQDQSQNYLATYFFQVDYTVPEDFVNLRDCYRDNYKFVQLQVPGLEKDEVTMDMNYVVHQAQKTLAEALNVGLIRINNPSIYFEGYDGYIWFALLGKAPSIPNVEPLNEPTLDEALATLKSIAGTGKLQLEVGNSEDLIKSEAFYMETKDNNDRNLGVTANVKQGYTSSDMAGLAFGMILVGLVAGAAGGYWFFIMRA